MAKTKGVKNCTPGNVKCGQRCIPQSWDCRLRGEGQDKALKASQKLDPLATFAQVERGIKRIGKGIKKGSFSEIEGGRKQLIRVASRNASGKEGKPLTLKEKKEIQDRLIRGTAILGTAAAVLAGGYTAHRTLMRAPSYRSRVGNRINNAANDAQNALLDSIPLSGGRRVANARTASEAGGRAPRLTAPTQGANRAVVLGSVGQPPSGPAAELNKRLGKLKFSPNASASQIEAQSLRTYLTSRAEGKNIHAEASAMETLASAYGVKLRREGSVVDVRRDLLRGVGRVIDGERAAIRSDMQQRGFAITNPEQQSLYIEAVFGGDAIREKRVRDILATTKGEALAKTTLDELTRDWGGFYESTAASIGDDIKRLSGNRALAADKNDIVQILRVKHAEYLDRNMVTKAGGRINRFAGASEQQASMQLTTLEFHARKNGSKVEWSASKPLVNRAAKEQGISTDNINDTYMELSKKFVGLRGEVMLPPGVTRQARQLITTKSFTDQEAILKIYQRLLRERTSRTSSSELMRRAVAEHARNKKRNDSATRIDFTNPQDRAGKPCGKSFIPKSRKCSKKSTTAAYANKPKPDSKTGGGDNTLGKVLGGTALAAGAAVAGGVAAFKNRRRIGLYSGNSKTIARGMNAAIVRMNQKDIKKGISKLPKPFQKGASQLLGKAKAAAAYVAADVQGFEMRNVDTKNNFSTWSTPDKSRVMNIGSVDDTLMVFNAKQTGKAALRTENGKSVPIYDMDFTADLGFQQKEGVSRESGMATVKMVKAMNKATIPELNSNALLKNVPYAKDRKGDRRASLYKRAGYRELQGQRGTAQWAMLNNGKVEQIPEGYDSFFDALIRGKSYEEASKAMRGDSASFDRFDFTAASERKGKPCGNSFIGKTETCTKGRGTYAQRSQSKAAKSKPADPTPYITAAALLASATSVIVNRKAIARNLREIKGAVREMKGGLGTPDHVIAVENFAKKAKASTGFDVQHPSNKVWTKDLSDPQARRMDEANRMAHDMGLLAAQRKYKFNQAFDVSTQQMSDAVRRAKSPEANRFADAIDRLGISNDGDLAGNMRAVNDRSALSSSERAQVDAFYASVESDDLFPLGGVALDGQNKAIKQGLTGADKDRLYKVFRGHERSGRALNYSPDQLKAAIQVSRNASKKRTSGADMDVAERVAGGVATGPARGANADVGTLVHEAMHVMDFNGGNLRRREQLIARNQQAMLAEAEKYGFSQYSGLDPGIYNEFTAEAAVYYVFDSANFKKTAPTIYGMVEAIVTKAARV